MQSIQDCRGPIVQDPAPFCQSDLQTGSCPRVPLFHYRRQERTQIVGVFDQLAMVCKRQRNHASPCQPTSDLAQQNASEQLAGVRNAEIDGGSVAVCLAKAFEPGRAIEDAGVGAGLGRDSSVPPRMGRAPRCCQDGPSVEFLFSANVLVSLYLTSNESARTAILACETRIEQDFAYI